MILLGFPFLKSIMFTYIFTFVYVQKSIINYVINKIFHSTKGSGCYTHSHFFFKFVVSMSITNFLNKIAIFYLTIQHFPRIKNLS